MSQTSISGTGILRCGETELGRLFQIYGLLDTAIANRTSWSIRGDFGPLKFDPSQNSWFKSWIAGLGGEDLGQLKCPLCSEMCGDFGDRRTGV